jgi:flagellar assembly factor FliW
VNIVTTRFGEIQVNETKVIDMRGGILGFEHLKKFVLHIQEEKNPFWWFQSLDDGTIAFVVINPFIAKGDYEPVLDDYDAQFLEIKDAEDVVMLAIVTIRQTPFSASVNLRAPIVINAKKRIAKQVVLEDTAHSIQYYLKSADSDKDISSGGNSEKQDNCGAASL